MHTKIGLAAALLLSSSAFALAQDGPGKGDMSPGGGQKMERAPGGGGDSGPGANSARENAPGQMKGDGPAKEVAPGQTKDGRSARDAAPGQNKQDSAEKNSDGGKSGMQKSGDKADNEKTGNKDSGATGKSTGESGSSAKGKGSVAEITTEQKTRARTAFGNHKVEPAKNINVNVSVGVVVPRTVHFYSIPADVVEIVPVYRGYKYFMLDPVRIVIVDPDTYEVVDIIVIA